MGRSAFEGTGARADAAPNGNANLSECVLLTERFFSLFALVDYPHIPCCELLLEPVLEVLFDH